MQMRLHELVIVRAFREQKRVQDRLVSCSGERVLRFILRAVQTVQQ